MTYLKWQSTPSCVSTIVFLRLDDPGQPCHIQSRDPRGNLPATRYSLCRFSMTELGHRKAIIQKIFIYWECETAKPRTEPFWNSHSAADHGRNKENKQEEADRWPQSPSIPFHSFYLLFLLYEHLGLSASYISSESSDAIYCWLSSLTPASSKYTQHSVR